MKFITQAVDNNELGSRLDKWARRKFPNLSFTELTKFIRKGEIRIDGAKSEINHKLQASNTISYTKFIENLNNCTEIQQTKNSNDSKQLAKLIESYVIFEDADVLAINKPQGLAVQGGTKIKRSVAEGLKHINKEYRIVHRLDKYTSGVLVVAKNLKTAKALGHCFSQRKCLKSYLAICTGKLPKREGEIHYSLLQSIDQGQEKMLRSKEGLACQTKYRLTKQGKRYCLVELQPITGRKHQLRAHLSIINCPIVGDVKYGGKVHKHTMLHAKYINFVLENEVYSIEAPPPSYFQQMMDDM